MSRCEKPYVITISHLIGSGGGVVGKNLAEQLCIPLIDREILQSVAQKLHLAEAELEGRDQRITTFWQSFQRMVQAVDPVQIRINDRYVPSDRELFQTETETILRIAENSQAIFLGRACRYILQQHPCHFSLLVHAGLPDRIQRLCKLHTISAQEAAKMIETNDRERSSYIQTFTRQAWLDPRLYDLCLNTSSVGLEKASEIAYAAITAKLEL
jgi:cytidylate kinase